MSPSALKQSSFPYTLIKRLLSAKVPGKRNLLTNLNNHFNLKSKKVLKHFASHIVNNFLWFQMKPHTCPKNIFKYLTLKQDPRFYYLNTELHTVITIQWHHNEGDCVSIQWRFDCLFDCLFRRKWKKTSKLSATGLCEGNRPVSGGFPSHRASNTDNAGDKPLPETNRRRCISSLGVIWPQWFDFSMQLINHYFYSLISMKLIFVTLWKDFFKLGVPLVLFMIRTLLESWQGRLIYQSSQISIIYVSCPGASVHKHPWLAPPLRK